MLLRRASVLVAVVLLAGCSNRQSPINKRPHTGTGTASAVAGVQQITVTTGLDYRFHPSTLVVHPGRVRIVLVNTSKPGAGPPHDVVFRGLPAGDVPLAEAGQARSVTFTAPAPGTYNFVCSIHARQGQTGQLIVR